MTQLQLGMQGRKAPAVHPAGRVERVRAPVEPLAAAARAELATVGEMRGGEAPTRTVALSAVAARVEVASPAMEAQAAEAQAVEEQAAEAQAAEALAAQ